MKDSKLRTAMLLSFTVLFFSVTAAAQTFTTLARFNGTNGAHPELMSLIQGLDGGLYGMTIEGGNLDCGNTNGCGTVFKIGPRKGLTTVYSFCSLPGCSDGGYPTATLLLARDGNLYGTTEGGGSYVCGDWIGCGTVFRITRDGTLTTLHIFDNLENGFVPYAGLVQANGGDFYGTTAGGGTYQYGTVFKMAPDGTFATLHSFAKTDGAPLGNVIEGDDGKFYGTTYGFPVSAGSVFQMTSGGTTRILPLEPYNIGDPFAGLAQDNDGNFYGTTYSGAIFKVTPAGHLTVLYQFCSQQNCSDGYQPQAPLALGTDGNLYGTTRYGGDATCKCGTVFQITPTGVLTTLHRFTGTDGANPMNGLVQATSGVFYGVVYAGGNQSCYSDGCGTIFSLDMGLGPFVSFVSRGGKVGESGGILGQGFTGTTSVLLNGVPADFTVLSDTYIRATVPPGATSGYVTVTTPSGTLTSNVPFHVIP